MAQTGLVKCAARFQGASKEAGFYSSQAETRIEHSLHRGEDQTGGKEAAGSLQTLVPHHLLKKTSVTNSGFGR